MNDIVEYVLPACWASALVNGDESGLDDEEIRILDKWLEAEDPGICVGVSKGAYFSRFHDVSWCCVLPCDCLNYEFRKIAI